jgi:ABC-type lipoprotein export system ATPase subunit
VPISALLQQLNRQGVTLVVVTHDPLVAAAMGRQVQLRDGQIVADSGAGSGAGGGRP